MKIKLNKEGKPVYLNDSNQTMISISGVFGLFNKDIEFVPDKYIENATIFGKNIMVGLKSLSVGDNSFLSKISEEEKKCLNVIVDKLVADKLEIEQVECHIDNGIFHGFVDIKLKDNKFIELKCKSEDKLEKKTIIQTTVYKYLLGPQWQELIWYYNKKTGQIKEYKLTPEQSLEANKFITYTEALWHIINPPKKKKGVKNNGKYLN